MKELSLCEPGYKAIATFSVRDNQWDFETLHESCNSYTRDQYAGKAIVFNLPDNVDASEVEEYVSDGTVKAICDKIHETYDHENNCLTEECSQACLELENFLNQPNTWPDLGEHTGLWDAFDYFQDTEHEKVNAGTTDAELEKLAEEIEEEEKAGYTVLYNTLEFLTACRDKLIESVDSDD